MKRLLLGLLLASCAKMSWVEHPITTPPDRACRVGIHSVTDYYIWDCLNNEHVVVYQFGNYFGPTKPKREVSACGTKTPIEQKEELAPGCEEPPSKFDWNAAVNKRGRVSRD